MLSDQITPWYELVLGYGAVLVALVGAPVAGYLLVRRYLRAFRPE